MEEKRNEKYDEKDGDTRGVHTQNCLQETVLVSSRLVCGKGKCGDSRFEKKKNVGDNGLPCAVRKKKSSYWNNC